MPEEYNLLYERYRNLNVLLAHEHAHAMQTLAPSIPKGKEMVGIVDQFAKEHVIRDAFTNKKISLYLFTKAEERDIVASGASILARDAFIKAIKSISQGLPWPLLKGTNPSVHRGGIQLYRAGVDLNKINKMHFSTYKKVVEAKELPSGDATLKYKFHVDPKHSSEFLSRLQEHEFSIRYDVPYTFFLARKGDIAITFYRSGSLILQGKEGSKAIPILKKWIGEGIEHPRSLAQDLRKEGVYVAYMGVDESGKKSLSGPLCSAVLYASPEALLKISSIRDSTKISDREIRHLAEQIRSSFAYRVRVVMPEEYNLLLKRYRDLNDLLSHEHAQSVQELVSSLPDQKKWVCVVDQYGDPRSIRSTLQKMFANKDISLRLSPEVEAEGLVVAGAAILARGSFLEALERLSQPSFRIRSTTFPLSTNSLNYLSASK